MTAAFDYDAYRAAFEAKDVARWLAFYAEDAEWVEYRHSDPPRAPNVMRGSGETAPSSNGSRRCRSAWSSRRRS